MANLTRYNLMFDKSPGPTLCEMVVDHNGAWVKFADIEELLQTSPNTARDEICHCEHREGWLAFKHSWALLTVVYCPSCSGKLSPVA
jgi:hypothetical protein